MKNRKKNRKKDRKRRELDLDEVEEVQLDDLFQQEIDSNFPLTVDLVSNKIKNTTSLAHLDVNNKALLKKIMNKLRYLQKKKAMRKMHQMTTEKDERANRLQHTFQQVAFQMGCDLRFVLDFNPLLSRR